MIIIKRRHNKEYASLSISASDFQSSHLKISMRQHTRKTQKVSNQRRLTNIALLQIVVDHLNKKYNHNQTYCRIKNQLSFCCDTRCERNSCKKHVNAQRAKNIDNLVLKKTLIYKLALKFFYRQPSLNAYFIILICTSKVSLY